MPKFIVDKNKYEPIEVELDGKTFKIETVSRDMLETLMEFADTDGQIENADLSIVDKQLSILFKIDPASLDQYDMRIKRDILEWVTNILTEQLGGESDQIKKSEPVSDQESGQ